MSALVVLLGILFSTSVCADQLDGVRVRLVNGSSIRASIESIDRNGAIVGSENLANKTVDDLTGILTGRTIEKAATNRIRLNLKFGGQLFCKDVAVEGDRVQTVSNAAERDLPVEVVEAVVWRETSKVIEALQNPSKQFDSVIVSSRKGDVVVDGLIDKIDPTHVVMEYNGKSRKISIEKVQAVVFAKLEMDRPKRAFARAFLLNGSVVCGEIKELSDGLFTIGISDQFDIPLPVSQLARVEIQSKSVVYLSDLQPLSFEQQAQFALPRKWQRDKTLLGNPIQLKFSSSGRVVDFEKGIGTRSYTNLVFENSDGFSHFRAVVGIGSETGGNGDCEMVIEGDGIRLWSKRVTGASDPEPLTVSVSGINELALIVLPGENFDLADHAVWADAKFTKSE